MIPRLAECRIEVAGVLTATGPALRQVGGEPSRASAARLPVAARARGSDGWSCDPAPRLARGAGVTAQRGGAGAPPPMPPVFEGGPHGSALVRPQAEGMGLGLPRHPTAVRAALTLRARWQRSAPGNKSGGPARPAGPAPVPRAHPRLGGGSGDGCADAGWLTRDKRRCRASVPRIRPSHAMPGRSC